MVRIDPKKLRAARKAVGLTQAQVAEAVGLEWTMYHVSALERGSGKEITAEVADTIAKVLGVAPRALAVDESTPTAAGYSLDPARLKAARKAAGWTQKELAERSGFGQPSLSNLENGITGISLEGLQLLAKALDVSVNYLLGWSEEPHDQNPIETIRSNPRMPAGLRTLANTPTLIEGLQIKPAEWKALMSLAAGWQDAELSPCEGWVQVLVSLRAATTRRTPSQ